jgi:hypothetical protein
MFDQMKDLADRLERLHRERVAEQAEVARLRGELEQARRSWWRWLIGR